jgi:hypothetical protein
MPSLQPSFGGGFQPLFIEQSSLGLQFSLDRLRRVLFRLAGSMEKGRE